MKKWASFSYFFLAFICFLLLNVRFPFLENSRGPFFGFEDLFAKGASNSKTLEISELKMENRALKEQLEEVKAYLSQEDHINSLLEKCQKYEEKKNPAFASFYRRRLNQLIDLLHVTKWGISADVIFREPASWSSAIWVNVGSSQNKILKKEVVAVDSPVVFGDQLIGLIEKVDKHKSLVRLITDARLTPAVYCIRGYEQNSFIQNQCLKLKDVLSFEESENSVELITQLDRYVDLQKNEEYTEFLGKGFLSGSSHPVWRSRSFTLQGVGFNYDFGDEEGPPRSIHAETSIPLFRIGDALVTSGMDGVFPKGLLVAYVRDVTPMKEGAVSCELKAKICLPEFSDLRKVTILPPVSNL